MKVTTTTSISTSTGLISDGAVAKITASVKSGVTGVGGATIAFQQRAEGTSTWVVIKSVKADGRGEASITTSALHRNYGYRAVFAGSNARLASTSSTVAVRIRQYATVTKTSNSSPSVGDSVTLAGVTSAGLKGSAVNLQMISESRWVSIATSTVISSGTFSVSARATQSGTKQYRVVVGSRSGITGATTASKTFSIYKWFNLSAQTVMNPHYYNFSGNSVQIAGRTYMTGLINHHSSRTSWNEYNLSYRCRAFSAVAGLWDSSASGAAHYSVKVDDLEVATADLALGKSKTLSLSTVGGFRIRLEASPLSGQPRAAWGDPKVLCLSAP